MKTLRAVAVAFAVVRLGTGFAASPEPSPSRYDFGTVKQGETVRYAFPLKNAGSSTLTITAIELSAPGMTARSTPSIAPGEEASIAIEWDTEAASRQVVGTATVRFADPDEPPLVLELAGTVVPPIDGLPLWGFFVSAFRDQAVERTIRIVNNQDHPLEIKSIESPSPLFRTSLKTVRAGKSYDLTIKLPPGGPLGHHTETIRLETGDAKFSTLQVPVNLFIKADVFANPDVVDFGEIDVARLAADPRLAGNLTQTVMMEKRKGTFAIEGIDSDLPSLKIRSAPAGRSARFRLDAELSATELRPGELTATIHVRTTDRRFPDIAIPVRARVK